MAPPSLPQPLGRLPGESPSWDDEQSWDDDPLHHRPAAHASPGPFERPRRSEVFGLPAAPASVGQARENVRETLTAWGAGDELCDDVVLVVSELVTNALTHTGSDRVMCRLALNGALLRVEVEDQNRSGSFPERRQPDTDDQNGRGLMLVGALSADWGAGASPHGSGSVVWAELAWRPAESATRAAGSPSREAAHLPPTAGTPPSEAASPTPDPERPDRPAEQASGGTASGGREAGARVPGAGLLGWEAASALRASAPPPGTGRPVPGAATASADDSGPPPAAALTVPAARRPAVTVSHVTRPVPRSAEGHLPHGTPAHP